ncbi:MAG: glycosyltransferase family 4 protein [Pseudochelatococcus sp.]|uniref:glycosyltransferase family 4 protein n=1 Tax=Pseudochelatococcus sp. TaxID=2020869 RepID=UPI003D927852
MRILHILNHTNRLNGHVHAAVDLACAQKESGHDVAIASGGGDFDALLAKAGVETTFLDHTRKPRELVTALTALRRFVRAWRPDVVHAHMMTSAVLAFPVCKLSGLPLVTTVHNAFEKSAILMGLGNRVIAVSEAVRASMRQRGIPASRLAMVLNGTIGSIRFRGRDRTPVALESPSILFVGGQHPRKGLPDLFDGFAIARAKHPDARLYIVGGGPYLSTYQEMVGKAPYAEAVTFVGGLDDPFPWMLGADILVLPSLADPAPLVLSEAREAGCAIIGTKVDGIPELLEMGEAGILVPPQSPQAIGEALLSLLDDPDNLAEWRRRSQLNIGHLTIDRVMRETLAVYEAAGAGKRSGRAAKN